jgi:hypothetical protein
MFGKSNVTAKVDVEEAFDLVNTRGLEGSIGTETGIIDKDIGCLA